jgi:hypothetical protein
MMRGETIRTGAPEICPTCLWRPDFEVHSSSAGYYIGTYCQCGPYTRESHYYRSAEDAQDDLDNGTVRWRDTDQHSLAQLLPQTRTVVVHAYVEIPNHLPVDSLLGFHGVKCIVSNNCDGYDGCIPAVIDIYHSHEQH